MLRYAVLGTLAHSQAAPAPGYNGMPSKPANHEETACDRAMQTAHGLDPKIHPGIHSAMDMSGWKWGDKTYTTSKCQWGPMKAKGSTTITCVEKNGKAELTVTGDLTCVPKQKPDMSLIGMVLNKPAVLNVKAYVHVFKGLNCGAKEAYMDITKDSVSPTGRKLFPAFIRMFRSLKTHMPEARDGLPDKYVGTSAVTVKKVEHVKDNILMAHLEVTADLNKFWQSCKIERELKSTEMKEFEEKWDFPMPNKCQSVKIQAQMHDMPDMGNFSVRFNGSEEDKLVAEVAEKKICPDTMMDWDGIMMLEMPLGGGLNVGMVVLIIMPLVTVFCCIPTMLFCCTCCCTCCCCVKCCGAGKGQCCCEPTPEKETTQVVEIQ